MNDDFNGKDTYLQSIYMGDNIRFLWDLQMHIEFIIHNQGTKISTSSNKSQTISSWMGENESWFSTKIPLKIDTSNYFTRDESKNTDFSTFFLVNFHKNSFSDRTSLLPFSFDSMYNFVRTLKPTDFSTIALVKIIDASNFNFALFILNDD